jgi:hypothetical protein
MQPALLRPRRRDHLQLPATAASAFLLLVGLIAVLIATVPAPAGAQEDLDALRARIKANGWSWEPDDTFIRSLTPEQRENLRGFVPPPGWDKILADRQRILPVDKDLPSSFSWIAEEGVTNVRDQGTCGSCWAFAAIGQIESFVKIYYNQTLNVSEQQIISCNPYGSGCGGGWAGAAYYVCEQYGGVNEGCMPYQGAAADLVPCTQEEHLPFAFVQDWYSVANDVTQIKTALLDGPVCTLIDASTEFEEYGDGCYDVPGYGTNHVVVIVGWDDRLCDQEGAWIIRNSWGAGWGMGGYAYVKYGAAATGTGVTQIVYTPPPVQLRVTGVGNDEPLWPGSEANITWTTAGTCDAVDIRFASDGSHYGTLIAENVPNTGSYVWQVPNLATTHGKVLVHAHAGTDVGFGMSLSDVTIFGHSLFYVSAAGSDTPPYDTPAKAAHTISEAIAASTGLDSVFVAEGSYQESLVINRTIKLIGGWDATFSERDPGLHPTRLTGFSTAVRLLAGSYDFGLVDGFIFEDCRAGYYSSPHPGNHGGAIFCMDCTPTITDCRFQSCRSAISAYGLGGAVMAVRADLQLTDCEFTDNLATGGGAMALFDSDAILSGNTFTGNGCRDSLESANRGAAILVEGGTLSLSGDVFLDNVPSNQGGGVALHSGALTATGATWTGNRAQANGGAVCADSSQVDLRGGSLHVNSAGALGGGLYLSTGALNLANVVIEGNSAGSLGGGVIATGLSAGAVENCLLADNGAPYGGGGALISAAGPYLVRNNIITGNTVGLSASGAAMVADYNDVWGNTTDYSGMSAGAHDLAADPLLVDPAGGDYGLGLHSPCLDRGDPDPGCQDPDGSRNDVGPRGGPAGDSEAPCAVAGASLTSLGGGAYRLTWAANPEPDVVAYIVYRDTAAVFMPGPDKVAAQITPPATSWDDTPAMSCYYLVVARDADGHVGGYSDLLETDITAVGDDELPTALALTAVVPNPFNPRTTVHFALPAAGGVTLTVFDLRGRRVRTLLRGELTAGRHEVEWDGRVSGGGEAAAGVYLLRLEAGGQARSVKIVLAR